MTELNNILGYLIIVKKALKNIATTGKISGQETEVDKKNDAALSKTVGCSHQ